MVTEPFAPHEPARATRARRLPALFLGLGLGGFIDGIVLHQVLQWHHLLTDTDGNPMTTVPGLEANTLADGLFHLATWVLVAVGLVLSFDDWRRRRVPPPWPAQLGLVLTGWGVFNLVEGIVDHQILQIHHVRDDLGGPLSWDLGFLAFGALLVVVGLVLERRAGPRRSA